MEKVLSITAWLINFIDYGGLAQSVERENHNLCVGSSNLSSATKKRKEGNKMGNMIQCRLRKDSSRTTSWIPERGAKVGMVVELKSPNGHKDAGWEVVSVGGKMDEKDLHDINKMHRTHRQGSDI